MSSTSMDIDIFAKLAKLPLEIITIILDYLPKCILPKLLYLSPIRKIVASAILLDVEITEHVKGTKGVTSQALDSPNVTVII